nr:hypothetical protein [Fulvivirga sedimenti]
MEISSSEAVCPICGYEFPSRYRKNWSMLAATILLLLLLILIFLP